MTFNLDDLKAESAGQEIRTIEQPTANNGIREVSISEIKPYKEKVDPERAAQDEISNKVDAAIERAKRQIDEAQDKFYAEELDRQLDAEDDFDDEDDSETFASDAGMPDGLAGILNGTDEEHVVHEKYTKVREEAPKEETVTVSKQVEEKDDLSRLFDMDNLYDFDDEDDEDENPITEDTPGLDNLKKEVKSKIVPIKHKIDLTSVKINTTPVNVSRMMQTDDTKTFVADWVLWDAKRPISMSEFTGAEINKLDPTNSSRNRMNIYKDIYTLIYNHIVDVNKPNFETWLKTTHSADIDHLYFAIYKACFDGNNSVAYQCPHCEEMFMVDTNLEDMIKYKDDKVRDKVLEILNNDTTTESTSHEYETELMQISDRYVIALREPSIWQLNIEPSTLDDEFIDKYRENIGIMPYIDNMYVINNDGSISPIDTRPVPNNTGKTIRRRVQIFHKILASLTSDQYFYLASHIGEFRKSVDEVTYVLPEVTCPKCGKQVKQDVTTARSLLFTRHRLAALANS